MRALMGERLFYGLIGLVAVLVVWEATAQMGLYKRSLMSLPSSIVRVAIEDMTNGTIWPHVWVSAQEFIIGFVASLVVGIPLGLAIGLFRRVDYTLSALLAGLNATPNVALIPLIILLFGLGVEAKAVVVFLSAFFAIMVTTFTGVQATARRHLEITRSFGGSPWLAFRSVVLPSTLPFIISGIRIGAGRALVGVVSAEILSANVGLGFYIALKAQFLDTARAMFGIILFGLFGLFIGEGVRAVERRFEAWRPELHH
ncbi:MAG TPA: ABC transporter permease [Candidatus Limnocylindria bacterium]|nr:ABC transporter permease [Candidatus Limnocylindria bacterium]